jgi:hypothetical protein
MSFDQNHPFYYEPEPEPHPFDDDKKDGIKYTVKKTYTDEEEGEDYYTAYAEIEGMDIEADFDDPGIPDHATILEYLESAFESACEPEYLGYKTPGGYTIY